MGYLDRDGLAYLWQKIKTALAGKQDTITPGDGLSKDGDTLSVDNPVRGIMTKAEFDALPEEEKAKGMYIIDDGQSGGPCGVTYDGQERVIGTWFGKPLYQKGWKNLGVADINSSGSVASVTIPGFTSNMQILEYSGRIVREHDGAKSTIPGAAALFVSNSGVPTIIGMSVFGIYNIEYLVLRYTKTTDQEVSA